MIRHYSEKDFAYAEDLCKKQGLYAKSISYIDSIYNTFPYVSIADKYQYYFFRSRLTDSAYKTGINTERSITYTDSMQLLIEENGLQKKMANEYAAAFRLKGEFAMSLGKYEQAFKAVSMCKFLSLQGGDSCNTGINSATLGFIAFKQNKYLQAVDYFKTAIALFRNCKNDEDRFYQMQGHLDDLALSYAKAGQLDNALKYYSIAESYILQNKGLTKTGSTFPYEALMVVYGNAADAARLKKEYDRSEYYIRKSLALNTLYFNNSTETVQSNLQLAELYLARGNFSTAYDILNKAKSTIFTFDQATQLYWLRLMPVAANKTGNSKDELIYTRLLYAKKDSFIAKERDILQADPGFEYERIQKRYELDLLRKNNELQRTYIIAAIYIVVLFISLALAILWNLKRSKKLNAELLDREQQLKQLMIAQETAKEKERKDELFLQGLRLQMEYNDAVVAQRRKISEDLHDGLSSSLAALKFYIEDVTTKIKDKASKEVLHEISAEVRSVYENATRYMQNLQANTGETHYDLIGFLTDISKGFSEKELLNISLDIDKEKIKILLHSFQHDHLYHIIREAIANVIKHGHATELNIKIHFTHDSCYFIVSDNGKGFDELKIKKGIGLNSIKTRVNELEGSFGIVSSGKGTVLKGTFPLF